MEYLKIKWKATRCLAYHINVNVNLNFILLSSNLLIIILLFKIKEIELLSILVHHYNLLGIYPTRNIIQNIVGIRGLVV